MLYPYLSKNIKEGRKKLGLTQKELAKKLMKSEISIRKYESGKVNIPPSTLFDISSVLNIDPERLLGKDSDKYHLENFGDTLQERLNFSKELSKTKDNVKDISSIDLINNRLKKINKYKTHSYKLNETEVNEINKILVTSFMKFINNIGLDFFNNLTSNEVLNVINSEELYKTLEYLYFKEQNNKLNSFIEKIESSLKEIPKTEKQIWEEEGKEYLMPKAAHELKGDFTEEDYKHDEDIMMDDEFWSK